MCHVMSCDVMWRSCHLMWCDFLCCVTSRNAMRCHVMCSQGIPYLKWNVQYNARSNSLTDTCMHMHLRVRALDLICSNVSVTSHVAHNHINSPQVTSQLTTLLHQNTSPQSTWHHKIAEWHCAGQSPGGHPIGKFYSLRYSLLLCSLFYYSRLLYSLLYYSLLFYSLLLYSLLFYSLLLYSVSYLIVVILKLRNSKLWHPNFLWGLR